MSIHQSLLKEIKIETEKTRAILSRLSDEHLDWKPHHKSMSVKELASHVVELHNWVGLALVKEKFDFHVDYQRPAESTIAGIRQVLEDGYQRNVDAVESLSEEQLLEGWTLAAGDHVIASMPRLGAYRFMISNHLIHHRGQLSLYLRLLDLPVPGIYGPSADESQ